MELQVSGVSACDCLDHARVVLRPAGSPEAPGRCVRVRVDSPSAQAVAAELAGIPGPPAAYVDLFLALLEAFGGRVESVDCNSGDDPGSATIRITAGDAIGRLRPVSIGAALVVAARLRVPVTVSAGEDHDATPVDAHLTSNGAQLPPAIAAFLEGLDLS